MRLLCRLTASSKSEGSELKTPTLRVLSLARPGPTFLLHSGECHQAQILKSQLSFWSYRMLVQVLIQDSCKTQNSPLFSTYSTISTGFDVSLKAYNFERTSSTIPVVFDMVHQHQHFGIPGKISHARTLMRIAKHRQGQEHWRQEALNRMKYAENVNRTTEYDSSGSGPNANIASLNPRFKPQMLRTPRLKNLISEALARLGLMLVLHLPFPDLRTEESHGKEIYIPSCAYGTWRPKNAFMEQFCNCDSQQPYQSNPPPLPKTSSSNLSKTLPTPFRATLNCESALTRE